MESSEITSTGENMPRQNTLRSPQLTPLLVTKDALTKTSKSASKPTIYRGPVIKYEVDISEFRSIVQRLTGNSPMPMEEIETISCKTRTPREIKAYEDMRRCFEFCAKKLFDQAKDAYTECVDLLAYCSLFPKDYEVDDNTLVQLWMAAGLVKDEPMEDIGTAYLRALRDCGVLISLSRQDFATGKVWYKVNGFKLAQQVIETSRISLLRLNSDNPIGDLSVKTEPFHLSVEHMPKNLDVLGKFPKIRTILLLRGHECKIDRLPYDFFLSLELIHALDLSGTKLTELPSSIGNARCLRYLDLSETLIKQLPETIDCLQNLQTLKLRNCPRLIALPKGTRRLTSLRHLELGSLRCLHSMAPGMRTLSSLCTLSNFVASKQNGCTIGELKNMNKLRGKICLSRLENVVSLVEAMEANLKQKTQLTKLELQWTYDIERESVSHDDQILEVLQPPTSLKDLRILCYGGSTFPSWISDPTFDKLVSITIFKCENCKFLPTLGQLPELESLNLIELPEVRVIDSYFCRDINTPEHHSVAFPRLKKLAIKSMVNLGEWRDLAKLDFPRLIKLEIKDCPELIALSKFSSLQSLEYLEINRCAKLLSLLEWDLPASINMLVIEDCPSLICFNGSMDETKDWHKIEHSPSLLIYQRDQPV